MYKCDLQIGAPAKPDPCCSEETCQKDHPESGVANALDVTRLPLYQRGSQSIKINKT